MESGLAAAAARCARLAPLDCCCRLGCCALGAQRLTGAAVPRAPVRVAARLIAVPASRGRAQDKSGRAAEQCADPSAALCMHAHQPSLVKRTRLLGRRCTAGSPRPCRQPGRPRPPGWRSAGRRRSGLLPREPAPACCLLPARGAATSPGGRKPAGAQAAEAGPAPQPAASEPGRAAGPALRPEPRLEPRGLPAGRLPAGEARLPALCCWGSSEELGDELARSLACKQSRPIDRVVPAGSQPPAAACRPCRGPAAPRRPHIQTAPSE